jgi:carbon monoxide dehydrogenase subunit G
MVSSRAADAPERGSERPSRRARFQQVRQHIVVDAPIAVVWDVAHDPAAFVEAIDWVSEVRIEGAAPLREGSVYLERATLGLSERTYRWEITAYDPPTRSVHAHESGGLEAELEVRCEAVDEGTTRYEQILRFRALPAFRPLGYLVERAVMKRRIQRDFDEMILPNFKRIAERRATE